MRNSLLIYFLAALMFISCGRQAGNDSASSGADTPASPVLSSEVQQAFFNNLALFCGKAFGGKQVFRSHHGAGWAHLELVMLVRDCEADKLAIPFRVGDDYSRTWLFLVEDGQLRFRHDHRHPDGTPEEETLYGGYADNRGTAFVQYFPADDYTAGLIDGGGGNVWTVSISEDLSTFTYRLDRDGEKRFVIEFDLNQPLDPNVF